MRRTDSMQGGENFSRMTVADFMETEVYYYAVDSRGEQIATALTLGNFGSVPIVNKDKKLIGIVSEFDLLKTMKNRKKLREVTAREIMTKAPISVREETRVEELINLLQREHLIRVPVVDEEGKLVGIVARRDVLQGYLKSEETRPPWWF